MNPRQIAICVFRNGTRILAALGYDGITKERFFRPLGGAIEVGETAEHALRREIHEELGQAIANVVELGVIDNRFEYEGRRAHETVFVFDASFVDKGILAQRSVPFRESGRSGSAQWLDLSDPLPAPLYPRGLPEILRRAV